VLAVYTGAYDVGTIRKGTLDVVRDKIDLDQIRVLAESRPYPGWVYSVRKGFDPASTDKIARALLDLDMSRREDAVILGAAGMIGIIPPGTRITTPSGIWSGVWVLAVSFNDDPFFPAQIRDQAQPRHHRHCARHGCRSAPHRGQR
jgi:hypothetical protein